MERNFSNIQCCNPFNKASHTRKKPRTDLRNVTPSLAMRRPDLLVGQKVCTSCRLQIYRLPVPTTSQQSDEDPDVLEQEEEQMMEQEDVLISPTRQEGETTFIDKGAVIDAINLCLQHLKEEVLDKKRIKEEKYIRAKLNTLVERAAVKVFDIPTKDSTVDSSDNEIIKKLKNKFNETDDKNIKYMILSLIPESWTIEQTVQELPGATFYQIRKARQVSREKGVLSTPDEKHRERDPEIEKAVQGFYCNDEISRVMPGARDFISIKVIYQTI